jgi:glycogen phosphorylase
VSTPSVIETIMTSEEEPKSLERYDCGPVHLIGSPNGLYERHLFFDNVIDGSSGDSRDRFEACARSVRDVLSQRWVSTEKTYDRLSPKRIYYLSMEFLIGRSLANNVTNLFLDGVLREAVQQRPAFWTRWPPCSFPPWATA